ncbi:hypothetical protein FI667_g12746, partial [Globisporangium splendens]
MREAIAPPLASPAGCEARRGACTAHCNQTRESSSTWKLMQCGPSSLCTVQSEGASAIAVCPLDAISRLRLVSGAAHIDDTLAERMEPRFPLDATQLPTLQVDRHTLEQWTRAAQHEIAQLLADRESWYYRGQEPKYAYKLIYNKKGLEGFINTAEAARRKEFYAQGILKMYLEDVSYGLYCETTLAQRSVNAFLDDEDFLDAAVLLVDGTQSIEDAFQFSGVKWVAMRSPPGVSVHSDFVYFECSCTMRDADGRTVLVQYTTCPDLTSSQLQDSGLPAMFARGKSHRITTFRADPEGTHVQCAGTLVANEEIPSWVGMKSVLQAFASLNNVVGVADARAISSLGVANAVSTTAKCCYLCKKKFSMLRTRQHCRVCGHNACKNCTVKLKFINEERLLPSSSSLPAAVVGSLVVEDKFCLPCVRRSREHRPEGGGGIMQFVNSIVSVGSSQTNQSSFDDVAFETGFSDLHGLSDNDSECNEALYHKSYAAPPQRHTTTNGTMRAYLLSPKQSNLSISPVMAFMAQHGARSSAPSPPPARLYRDAGHGSGRGGAQYVSEAFPVAESFSKLSQSIAAQEAILQSMHQEQRKLHAYQRHAVEAVGPVYALNGGGADNTAASRLEGDASNDRFEILPDAAC